VRKVALEGPPANSEAARKYVMDAHKAVTDQLAAFKPKPSATPKTPGRRINAPVSSQPTNMREAIEAALTR
jgi:hypothetical protein